MPPLPTHFRKTLKNAIIAARRAAEEAARASLTTLAVTRPEPFATMDGVHRAGKSGDPVTVRIVEAKNDPPTIGAAR